MHNLKLEVLKCILGFHPSKNSHKSPFSLSNSNCKHHQVRSRDEKFARADPSRTLFARASTGFTRANTSRSWFAQAHLISAQADWLQERFPSNKSLLARASQGSTWANSLLADSLNAENPFSFAISATLFPPIIPLKRTCIFMIFQAFSHNHSSPSTHPFSKPH